MKITLLTKEYPPYIYGGAGVHVKYLVKHLNALSIPNFRIIVYCFGDQNIDNDNLQINGFPNLNNIEDSSSQMIYDILYRNINMLQKIGQTDIVHAHTWYTGFAGLLIKKLLGIPFVYTCHSLEPLRPWKRKKLGNIYEVSTMLEKNAIESADKLIAVSNSMKEDIIKNFDVDENRITVIYNGIDDKWLIDKDHSTEIKKIGMVGDYILFVGRVSEQKGINILIDAFNLPFLKESNAKLLICTNTSDNIEFENKLRYAINQNKNYALCN